MALFSAGNAFSGSYGIDSAGGSSIIGTGGADGAVSSGLQPTKSTASESNQTSNKKITKNLTGTRNSVTNTNELERRNLQTVTDPVLAAIEAAIAGNATNETLVGTDDARLANIQGILEQLNAFDAQAIQQGAEGDVSQLTRQLLEDVLPQITGASEASGTSNNALAAILAQDATSRTAEAQARVREQARANSAQEFINLANSLSGAAQGGSAVQDNLVALINAAKGTVEQGTIRTDGTNTTQETTTGTETTDESGNVNVTAQEDVSSLADQAAVAAQQQSSRLAQLALLQSSLSPFQTLQDLTLNPTAIGNSGPGEISRNNSAASVRQLASLLGI